ncbi:MAG: amidohydrolase family protein [Mariniblastus sp.]
MKTNPMNLGLVRSQLVRIELVRFCMSLMLIACVTFPLLAQERGGRRRGRPTAPETKTETKTEDKDSAEPEGKDKPITAIVGADIHTVTGPMIRQGTILVQDGKILDVGQTVEVPKDAIVIDAAGKTITPGFVAISMQGIGVRTAPTGTAKLADSLDPFDRNMKYSLGIGITSGCIETSSRRGGRRRRSGEPAERFPGLEIPIEEYETEEMLDYGNEDTALCPCCGLPILPTEPITPARPTTEQPRKMAVIKMSYGNLDEMLLKETAFYSPSPGALSGRLQRHNWRLEIKKARETIAANEKAAKEKAAAAAKKTSSTASKTVSTKKPTTSSRSSRSSKVKPEIESLIKRETAMRIRVNTVDEIRDMVDLANELEYDLVIEGGIEAWVVGRELGASEVSVIYTPRQRRRPRKGSEDTTGSFIESPKIFEESGVPFAIATLSNSISMNGLAGRDLSSLPLEAAFSVRGGASEKAALAAITITPARMLGLEDRIGSIEKGKDADLLILNGSPLDYRTYVEHAMVAGKIAYDRAKEKIYPVYERKN